MQMHFRTKVPKDSLGGYFSLRFTCFLPCQMYVVSSINFQTYKEKISSKTLLDKLKLAVHT